MRKYWNIYKIYFKTSLSRDLSFRMNFIVSFMGSFCYVILDYYIIIFLMNKINFGYWTEKQMLVLLGNYIILTYAIFFLFWRGFTLLIRNIRSGIFDYYLVKPADSQFLVSILGGGLHNFVALLFGFGLTLYGLNVCDVVPTLMDLIIWIIALSAAIMNVYSYMLLLICFNFRFGFLEEVLGLAMSFQSFTRYPIDAFAGLPIYLFMIAIPFSALSTIPSMVLLKDPETWRLPLLIFLVLSLIFWYIFRQIWQLSLKEYSSSN